MAIMENTSNLSDIPEIAEMLSPNLKSRVTVQECRKINEITLENLEMLKILLFALENNRTADKDLIYRNINKYIEDTKDNCYKMR